MKKYPLLLCVLLAALFSQAQPYSFIKTLNESIWKIVPAQNGTFYTVSWLPNCPNDYIVIRFCNNMGDVVNTFKSPAYIASLTSIDAISLPNNDIVLYVRSGEINHMFFEFNSSGSTIWNNNIQFTSPIIKYTKIISSPTGFYLVGNTYAPVATDSSSAVITKLSSVGKHQWTKTYKMNNAQASSTHYNDIMYDNNKLICAGRYYYTNAVVGWPPLRPVISLLDTSGNIQQSYYYMVDSSQWNGFDEYEFMQIDKTPNGHFYLVGNNAGNEHALFKMDNSYNIEWIREKLSGKSHAMCAGYQEDVFIAPDGEFNNFLLQFDSTGQVVRNHITKYSPMGNDLNYGYVNNLKRHDCGFLLGNSETMYAHTNKNMDYCLDSSRLNFGNYYPVNNYYRRSADLISGSLVNFNEYLSNQTYNVITSTVVTHCSAAFSCGGGGGPTAVNDMDDTEITIFPNPATTSVFISLPENAGKSMIELLDFNGKVLTQQHAEKNGLYRLDISAYAAGIYIIKVTSNKNSLYQKVRKSD